MIAKFIFGVFLVVAAFLISAPTLRAIERVDVKQDRFHSMLVAINKIRLPRDINLDCAKYVYPFLGKEASLAYYIDLFAKNGIAPSVVRQHENYHVGFEIGPLQLESVPNSKFGVLDRIAIVFIANGYDAEAKIHGCKAILKAAPQLP